MTERPTPSRRAAPKKRSARLAVAIIAVCVVLAGIGVFLWLVVFNGESNSKKATNAINAGLTLQKEGDLAGAYAKYQQALRYQSNNKFALYDLGVVDYLQSNPGLAEQHYRQALVVDPNYEPALYNLAIVEQSLGKNRYALSLYQKAVQVNPGDPNAHFNLALMLRAIGDVRDGNAQMRIARHLNPQLKDPGFPKPSGSTSASGSPSPTH